ncbi:MULTISPECIES: hypothetical protein [Burkholderiaceae]|uniref:hypothetical protein n=1 Tax=Burkholderiaceae TaxID=119060 RepID=UPI000976F2BE|nr:MULTISPECIES: hypothetical protein [Burkholderiaceae]MCG1018457.1 hypothetical protein [Mycetohabitans sp. B4]
MNFGVVRDIGGMLFGNLLFRLRLTPVASSLRFLSAQPVQAALVAVVGAAVFYQNGRAFLRERQAHLPLLKICH